MTKVRFSAADWESRFGPTNDRDCLVASLLIVTSGAWRTAYPAISYKSCGDVSNDRAVGMDRNMAGISLSGTGGLNK